MKRLAVALLLALAACQQGPAPVRADHSDVGETAIQELGKIEFPNSGAREAQATFLRGVLLLHSFEYEDAAEAFREAQAIDPDFALAYWGESLTYSHPIWNEDFPDKAHAALARLASSPTERLAKAPTEREKGLLAAAETLWGEGERLERNRAYADAMQALRLRFPEDHEVAALTALAILGTSGPSRDVSIYMCAAALAEEVYEENPNHPGAIHYAIHAYDDPVHAPLGLRMANRYAAVAPAAQHALHMPSHIYVALGMWRESIAANVRSAAAADARRERKSLGIDARGFHSLFWLAYSLLQLGREDEARALLADMQRDTAEKASERTRTHLASMRAAYLVDGAGLAPGESAEALAIGVDTQGLSLAVAAADLFVTGTVAARNGDAARAEAALAAIVERLASARAEAAAAGAELSCCRVGDGGYGAGSPERKAAEVMRGELAGEIALARGATEDGLALLREAAQFEDEMGFDFGPPTVVKPAHELLGEALLELGRAQEAVTEFDAALERAPRRARALLGKARALAAAGNARGSSATYAEVASMWSEADADLPERAELRSRLP